jgi:hypothetical protein
MKTVFVVTPGGIGWTGLVGLLEKHRIDRLIDAGPEMRAGFTFESHANLSPFLRWEEQVVRRDLKELLDRADGARLAFIGGGHLVRLVNELGGHCFRIEPDGRLVGITGARVPVIAMRRTPGTSHSIHSRF